MQVAAPPGKPVLIFDGDCNFCRRWISRWRQSTGEAVEYLPGQDDRMAERFPELDRERLAQAVQLVDTDGAVYSGAEAVFRSLRFRPPESPLVHPEQALRFSLGWWLYQHWAAFAAASEWGYRMVADHRAFFSLLTRLLWGQTVERPSYFVSRWLFVRLLGLVYLIAFVSLGTQILGLVGHQGIMPASQSMASIRQQVAQDQIGLDRFRLVPTLCWFSDRDGFLQFQCLLGEVLSVLLLAGIAPAWCLCIAWALYLSLTTIGGVFLGYQWDNLLLETGFLAMFIAPIRWWPNLQREAPPSLPILWLIRWLLFRLMFGSGCVKLFSGDATWRHLTALRFHYETQPLPTWLAWYAHQLPDWVQCVSVILMFAVELGAPILIFMPRRLRLGSAWAIIGLMVLIELTGNFTFFNLLTIALCLMLFDDAALLRWTPTVWREHLVNCVVSNWARARSRNRFLVIRRIALALIAVCVFGLTFTLWTHSFNRRLSMGWPRHFIEWVWPLRSFNTYGLFAVMTTSRPEIVVEGSADGQHWLPYEFKYKPGDLKRHPAFVAPFQPRLDWQMWFAALESYQENPWFTVFCHQLLKGSPPVLALLARNPFPGHPPRYVRAVLYEYHFTDFATRHRDGAWWSRDFKGYYSPVFSF